MKQPDFGKTVLDARKKSGLTQEELAEKCSINVRSLQRIENGKVRPRASTIRMLNKVLDLKLEGKNDMAPRFWLTLLHLSSFVPIIVIALIIRLVKKDDCPEMDRHGRDVLNFQISISIYLFVSALLIVVGVGLISLMIVGWYAAFASVYNAVRVAQGKPYKYLLSIRFIK
jgi:uncharacterized Tic20 family protein